ncbi:VOC family protein [Thalassospira marina]|uniref:VOC domain-containing protein n=1 Tax=Thalassospira marina TaxID=2048283 RepID=A0A2N3KZJ0_9PROT|nr:VOC family protein [Thalassospira marina]PKR55992.1 hypothetical protein COO20_01910 [Thalassospira marina]
MPLAATPLLSVANLNQSIAFYHCLGFRVVAQTIDETSEEPVWAMLESASEKTGDNDGNAQPETPEPVRLMLAAHGGVSHEERKMRPSFSGMVWFLECDDVRTLYDALAGQGYGPEPIMAIGDAKGQFFVRDPDGYEIAVSGQDNQDWAD